MDLLGDIVEKDISTPSEVSFNMPKTTLTGFPQPKKASQWVNKRSKFKQKQEESQHLEQAVPKTKNGYDTDEFSGLKRLPKEKQKLNYEGMSEAEKIHLENIEILNNMTEEERLKEKQELLDSFDPKILKSLLLRSEKKLTKGTAAEGAEYQGYGEWIGGDKQGNDHATWERNTLDKTRIDEALGIKSVNLDDDLKQEQKKDEGTKPRKSVRFDELSTVNYPDAKEGGDDDDDEWDDVEDIAPPSYQINQEAFKQPVSEEINVHFMKPSHTEIEDMRLDINDPDFNEKLHSKFFPDLPKETEKLQWMSALPEVDLSNLVFDDVSQLRFDFKGDLIIPSKNSEIDTSQGLHHHSDNPSLAGYTLGELAHLARSSMPGQRCIAIRTLGRILHKLGKGKYSIVPEFVTEEEEVVQPGEEEIKQASTKFDQMFWGVIDELRIVETLEESADEGHTSNLSVRNYAIEALWLWKQGGGNKRHAN